MNLPLGLRTLLVVALVAAATAILVHPCLVGAHTAPDQAFGFVPALAHN